MSPTVRATKLSFFQPRVSRYIPYMSLSVPPLGCAAPLYSRSRGGKPVSYLLRNCHREGSGGEVTTNYSGERDSDEMKRSDLAPFLSISPFLPICPQPLSALYTPFFRGANLADVTKCKEGTCLCDVRAFADIRRRRTNDLPPQGLCPIDTLCDGPR